MVPQRHRRLAQGKVNPTEVSQGTALRDDVASLRREGEGAEGEWDRERVSLTRQLGRYKLELMGQCGQCRVRETKHRNIINLSFTHEMKLVCVCENTPTHPCKLACTQVY